MWGFMSARHCRPGSGSDLTYETMYGGRSHAVCILSRVVKD